MMDERKHQADCPAGVGGRTCRCRTIPRVDDDGWHYLLRFPIGVVVQCAGDWDVARKHLQLVRRQYAEHHPDARTVPTLIGAYPPNSVGGPEGRGGVRSFGITPDMIGNIDIEPDDWISA